MVEAVQVKVASWNVWGLGISKKRDLRIKGISEHLKTLNADIILLQELWKRKDYELIKEALGSTYKSIRFEGGVVGCGLAVFSKLPLVPGSVGFSEFPVRGRMWRFWEGDWFTGKGYLYLEVKHPNSTMPIHIVNTHLQASYGGKYPVERAVQLLEITGHLRKVKTPFYILAGDLNTHPEEALPWTMLKQSVPFEEANGQHQPTCNVPGNTWAKKKAAPEVIDHILFSPALQSPEFEAKDVQSNGVSLSDHSLLTATLKASNVTLPITPQSPLTLETVVEFNEALGNQVQHLRRLKIVWMVLSGISLMICLAFAIAASVLAMADPSSGAALTVVMAILAPLGAALSLVFLAFALDAKSAKAGLKNQMAQFSDLQSSTVPTTFEPIKL